MRHLAVTIAAALVFALVAPAFAQPFADVPTNHWAYDAIAELAAKGIVEGFPDGTFRGDRAMTRFEMAMIVARLLARIESIQIPAPAAPSAPAPMVTPQNLQQIQRLVNEFRAELAALGVRVTAIEEDLNAIKARQSNVRFGGGFRFRYDESVSGGARLPRARELFKLTFDGSVSPDAHLIGALLTGGGAGNGQTYQIFNSSCFGAGTSATCTASPNQYVFGTVDNLFFDWKTSALGLPMELWLGRFGGSGIGFGTYPVQFGPFGLLMNTGGDTWEDSTGDSGANVVDGLYLTTGVPSLGDLKVQAILTRINGGLGGSSYSAGEDAWGVDANIKVVEGLRIGANYVGNMINSFSTTHLYGPGGGSNNPANGSNCTGGPGTLTCPALGNGYGFYVDYALFSGVTLDAEYATWNDNVTPTNDNGWQVNAAINLGDLTGWGHNFLVNVGYLSYGAKFIPPYGAAEADIAMADSIYPGNAQGFTIQASADIVSNWNLYAIYFTGNNVTPNISLTEYEIGISTKLAPNTKLTLKDRNQKSGAAGATTVDLYRLQLDYTF